MKKGERLINTARDKFSNRLLHAVDLFDNNKIESFRVRKDFNEKKINPVCVECGQDLTISPSIYDRLYFRHLPKHNYCILSSNSLTPQQQGEYFEIIKSNESLRHIELKNKIGNLLTQINEVDKSSVFIDNKFIIKNRERRKPDVYCKFGQVEIVFEIQLSKLPLWYILNRYNFYKENNIYLIWILDNFDVKNPDSFTRDIKYLNKYQNYFKLDESSNSFRLLCEYKKVYIYKYKVITEWKQNSIILNQLKFDQEEIQPYFYNYSAKLVEKKSDLEKIIEKEDDEKWNLKQEEKIKNRQVKIDGIISEIKIEKSKRFGYFKFIKEKIENFSYLEIQEFNQKLNLKNLKTFAVTKWISETTDENIGFLIFILETSQIDLDFSNESKEVLTPFITLYSNTKNIYKPNITKLLFERGYNLNKIDLEYTCKEPENKDFILYKIYDKLTDRKLVQNAFKKDSILLIFESAKNKKIIGFKFSNWISFANNAIQFYSQYWEYIELMLKKYGIWEMIIAEDKKETFRSKLIKLYMDFPVQEYDIDEIIKDLYPEIFE